MLLQMTEFLLFSEDYGLPWRLSGKESACQCRRLKFEPWVRKIPWRRKWQPTPVFLPGKSHGEKSLVGYSPCGHKRVRHDLATKHQWYIVCICMHTFFIPSSVDEHLSCFYILAILNNTSVINGIHVSFQITVFIFCGYILRVGLLDHMVILSGKFLKRWEY